MAGHWIKWEKGLLRKPEILEIARLLDVSEQHAASCCMSVWEWADDVTTDGLIKASSQVVDRIAGQAGMAEAMQSVGWLVVQEKSVQFPNYDRHNGRTAKERALDANRKAIRRLSMRMQDKNRT